ncbi:MAG: hypothetical protein C4521_11845 [Actinobacteria bacterium]|nr:MAG: hypothetical protein C4521_11845 [Actinomycetota bacterium]
MSAYCLSIEEGTPLSRRCLKGDLPAPDEDLAAEMMAVTSSWLQGEGYEHYEISNFARPGRRCTHNVDCWRYRDYIGFGPSAHSKVGRDRRANTPDVDAYVRACSPELKQTAAHERSPVSWHQRLSDRDVACEATMLGLRLLEGMPRSRLESLWATAGEDVEPRLHELECYGLLELGARVRLTRRGLLLANEVHSAFV